MKEVLIRILISVALLVCFFVLCFLVSKFIWLLVILGAVSLTVPTYMLVSAFRGSRRK